MHAVIDIHRHETQYTNMIVQQAGNYFAYSHANFRNFVGCTDAFCLIKLTLALLQVKAWSSCSPPPPPSFPGYLMFLITYPSLYSKLPDSICSFQKNFKGKFLRKFGVGQCSPSSLINCPSLCAVLYWCWCYLLQTKHSSAQKIIFQMPHYCESLTIFSCISLKAFDVLYVQTLNLPVLLVLIQKMSS
jgi:hypothetical protein